VVSGKRFLRQAGALMKSKHWYLAIKPSPLLLNPVRRTGSPLKAAQDADAKYLAGAATRSHPDVLGQLAGRKPNGEGCREMGRARRN
jgi:hypothetical protein